MHTCAGKWCSVGYITAAIKLSGFPVLDHWASEFISNSRISVNGNMLTADCQCCGVSTEQISLSCHEDSETCL